MLRFLITYTMGRGSCARKRWLRCRRPARPRASAHDLRLREVGSAEYGDQGESADVGWWRGYHLGLALDPLGQGRNEAHQTRVQGQLAAVIHLLGDAVVQPG